MFFVYLMTAVYFADIAFLEYCHIRDAKFGAFLEKNREALLLGGSCRFMGRDYTAETYLAKYRLCVSMVVFTHTGRSSYFPKEDEKAVHIFCNAVTLMAGWWGIPFGPIRTVGAIRENSAPEYLRLSDLLTGG